MTAALYYDLGSPYAYLAVERATRVLGHDPELRPVLLGAIFAVRGHGSWAQTADRAAHVAEVERRTAAYGLPPLTWPPGWPPSTLHAMRTAVWAQRHGRQRAFAQAAFRAQFAHGADLADPSTLHQLAAQAGLPADELPGALRDPTIKQELRARTDAALAAGVRGVPTLHLGDRLIYGDDRLDEATARPA